MPDNFRHTPHAPVPEPYLDAMRVKRGTGQDLLDYPPRQFSAPLVGFEYDINRAAGMYGIAVFSG